MVKRRDILVNVTGAAVGGVALSGIAGADVSAETDVDHEGLRRKYGSTERVADVVETHASDLLAELAEEGLVGSVDPRELPALRAGVEPAVDDDPVRVMSTVDGKTDTPTAVVRVTEPFPGGVTQVFVLPEAGRRYATIDYDDGERRLWRSDGVDCTYSHQEVVCSNDSCLTKNQNCLSAPCTVTYYVEETYDVYECEDCTTGSWCETYEERRLQTTVCTHDCCEDSGYGCECQSFGCSAE